jgi:hypothetical protein
MLNKISTFIFIILFITVFSYFNGEDFFDNIDKNKINQEQNIIISDELKNF